MPGEPQASTARATATIDRAPRRASRGKMLLGWALLGGIMLAALGLSIGTAGRRAHERAEEAARREALRDFPAPTVSVAAVDRRHGLWGTWVAADVALQSRCEHVITVGYRVDGKARGARALGSEVKTAILQPGERKVESLEFDYDPAVAPVDEVAAVLLWWNGPKESHPAGAGDQSKKVPVPGDRPPEPAAPPRLGPKVEMVGCRLVPYTMANGGAAQMVLVDWRNAGDVEVRAVYADITAFDASGAQLEFSCRNQCIYAAEDLAAGVAVGQVYYEKYGDGLVLPSILGAPGYEPAARVSVRLTRAESTKTFVH